MTIAGAVILAAIGGTLHWKRRVPRFVAWLMFLVGVGAATTIYGHLGGVTGMQLFGVGLVTVVAIAAAITFWEEAVKGNGLHRVRTPIIAVVFGVTLMSAGGGLFATVQQVVHGVSSSVDQTVTTNLNGSK